MAITIPAPYPNPALMAFNNFVEQWKREKAEEDARAKESGAALSASGALGGAASGAGVGTAIAPGIGTAIGAGVGALAGAFAGPKRMKPGKGPGADPGNIQQDNAAIMQGFYNVAAAVTDMRVRERQIEQDSLRKKLVEAQLENLQARTARTEGLTELTAETGTVRGGRRRGTGTATPKLDQLIKEFGISPGDWPIAKSDIFTEAGYPDAISQFMTDSDALELLKQKANQQLGQQRQNQAAMDAHQRELQEKLKAYKAAKKIPGPIGGREGWEIEPEHYEIVSNLLNQLATVEGNRDQLTPEDRDRTRPEILQQLLEQMEYVQKAQPPPTADQLFQQAQTRIGRDVFLQDGKGGWKQYTLTPDQVSIAQGIQAGTIGQVSPNLWLAVDPEGNPNWQPVEGVAQQRQEEVAKGREQQWKTVNQYNKEYKAAYDQLKAERGEYGEGGTFVPIPHEDVLERMALIRRRGQPMPFYGGAVPLTYDRPTGVPPGYAAGLGQPPQAAPQPSGPMGPPGPGQPGAQQPPAPPPDPIQQAQGMLQQFAAIEGTDNPRNWSKKRQRQAAPAARIVLEALIAQRKSQGLKFKDAPSEVKKMIERLDFLRKKG